MLGYDSILTCFRLAVLFHSPFKASLLTVPSQSLRYTLPNIDHTLCIVPALWVGLLHFHGCWESTFDLVAIFWLNVMPQSHHSGLQYSREYAYLREWLLCRIMLIILKGKDSRGWQMMGRLLRLDHHLFSVRRGVLFFLQIQFTYHSESNSTIGSVKHWLYLLLVCICGTSCTLPLWESHILSLFRHFGCTSCLRPITLDYISHAGTHICKSDSLT